MERANLAFNFIGVSVEDWHSAFKFFSETLGLKFKLDPKHGDWAILGGAWHNYYHQGSAVQSSNSSIKVVLYQNVTGDLIREIGQAFMFLTCKTC